MGMERKGNRRMRGGKLGSLEMTEGNGHGAGHVRGAACNRAEWGNVSDSFLGLVVGDCGIRKKGKRRDAEAQGDDAERRLRSCSAALLRRFRRGAKVEDG